MPRLSVFPLCGAALSVALLATPGLAGVVTYTDINTWNNAIGSSSLTNVTFDCSTCSPSQRSSFSTDTGGAVFGGAAASGFNGLYWLNYASYGGSVLVGGAPNGSVASSLWVTLPNNTAALGVNLALANGQTGTINVTADGTLVGSVNVGSTPNFTFYGITTTTQFGNVSFSSLNGQVVLDNVSFGAFSQVSGGGGGVGGDVTGAEAPDATTIVLAGSGLAFLAFSQRFRRLSLSS